MAEAVHLLLLVDTVVQMQLLVLQMLEDMVTEGTEMPMPLLVQATNKKMKLRASFFYCKSLMIFLASSFEIAPNWTCPIFP